MFSDRITIIPKQEFNVVNYRQAFFTGLRTPDMSLYTTINAVLFPRFGESQPTFKIVQVPTREAFEQAILRTAETYANTVYIGLFDKKDLLANADISPRGGWCEEQKARVFLRNINCKCYVNREKKVSVVLATVKTMGEWHMLLAGIPVFMPWFFESVPLTPDETALFKALIGTSASDYMAAYTRIVSSSAYRRTVARSILKGWEKERFKEDIRIAKDNVDVLYTDLADLNEKIKDKLRLIETWNCRLAGLMNGVDTSQCLIFDYFVANENLHLLSRGSDSAFTYAVTTTLNNFDSGYVAESLGMANTYLTQSDVFSQSDVRMLMKAIFVTQVVKVKMVAVYQMSPYSVSGIRKFDCDYSAFDGYVPNPHISQFGCIGDYSAEFASLLAAHDFVGAVEESIASAGSINVRETASFDVFRRDLLSDVYKAIEMPDGTLMCATGAIAWLKERGYE